MLPAAVHVGGSGGLGEAGNLAGSRSQHSSTVPASPYGGAIAGKVAAP